MSIEWQRKRRACVLNNLQIQREDAAGLVAPVFLSLWRLEGVDNMRAICRTTARCANCCRHLLANNANRSNSATI